MGKSFVSKLCPFGLTTATATQLVGAVHWDLYDSVGRRYLKDSSQWIGDRICVLFQTDFARIACFWSGVTPLPVFFSTFFPVLTFLSSLDRVSEIVLAFLFVCRQSCLGSQHASNHPILQGNLE
jgi:hypothetical protein